MDKEELIKTFINGPLQKYLTGDISFGKFIEVINEECGTNFKYSDLYPSYLFNATLEHIPVDLNTIRDRVETDFDKKMKECHQYGLCITLKEKPEGIFSVCRNCPLKKEKE